MHRFEDEEGIYSRGEAPDSLPVAMIHVDDNPSPIGLKDRAYGYVKKFPEIKNHAKDKKHKLMAFTSSHGASIAVGTLAATAGIIGAI